MNLVFYSGGEFNENTSIDNYLVKLVENKKKTLFTFIPSCSFQSDIEFKDLVAHYKKLGINKFLKFDIDSFHSETFRETIFKSDIIHLGGGNTFYFLKYLKETNLLSDLKSWVSEGGILTGLSAGAIIMTKCIETAGFPEFDRDENEDSLKNLNAMNLVNFEFFPHYRNSSRYDKELIAYSKKTMNPIYACPDGSGIMVLDKEVRFLGKTACFYQGQKNFILK